jgi:hypothetical protein
MSDQLQALLQQTGLMTPAFPANSRYNTTPITSLTSPNYQFYLSYLKLLGLVRDFHNNFLLPFWNVTADGLWNQHKDKITQAATAFQRGTGDQKTAAQKTYNGTIQKYTDQFESAFDDLQNNYEPIMREQFAIQDYIRMHPEVFAAGTEVESSAGWKPCSRPWGVAGLGGKTPSTTIWESCAPAG